MGNVIWTQLPDFAGKMKTVRNEEESMSSDLEVHERWCNLMVKATVKAAACSTAGPDKHQ